ncbi:uncharacterized protein G2W53_016080 [Senna tora]|uniref:Uncharacterized protein n=1 Tax=Senna tora TaxID=362788 RepID=A0A835CB77_9FABA|nr:uncharacterized protein G2W53_016080 [Senna tora]
MEDFATDDENTKKKPMTRRHGSKFVLPLFAFFVVGPRSAVPFISRCRGDW